jgi:mycothiol S-conjugate amidase
MTQALAGQPSRRTLLAVFAHPDDESFGPGGTLAKYAGEGAAVWLVCATDGAAGTVDAALLPNGLTVGALRRAELECAAGELRLQGVEWLGYRDSGMAGTPANAHPESLYMAPIEAVVAPIVHAIRQRRPQVVMCDNEFGGYGHPDHIKLHQATVQAFSASADPAQYPAAGPAYQPEALYFTAFNPGFLKVVVRLMPLFGRDPHKFGANGDIDLTQIARGGTPVHARLDIRPYYDVKLRASACHRSQGGPQRAFGWLPPFVLRQIMGFETFQQGYPEPQPGARRRKDLYGMGRP